MLIACLISDMCFDDILMSFSHSQVELGIKMLAIIVFLHLWCEVAEVAITESGWFDICHSEKLDRTSNINGN